MKKVGIVGWRGMVGSVLLQRMQEEGDFDHIEPVKTGASPETVARRKAIEEAMRRIIAPRT